MSAAGVSPASARPGSMRATDMAIPILRTTSLYNANLKPINRFDITKLGYATPVRTDGKTSFYKDGMDGICVPLTYEGNFAMNHGWIVRHGKFEITESTLKGDKQVQLVAHYPIKKVDEVLSEEDAATPRKAHMYDLFAAFVQAEAAAKKWITDDKDARMFGVVYSAADLEPKTRLDGKLEKGKFSSILYAGTKPDGDAAYLKSYFKLPHSNLGDETLKLYCELTLNGAPITPYLPHFLEHVTWRNDVGIVFSFKDLYKSTHGITLRVRVDMIGAWEPPKPVYVPLVNPFSAGSKMLEDDDTRGF